MENTKSREDGLEKLTGTVEGVIYANEENGYAILDFGTDSNELVTILGTLPCVNTGDELTVYGKWIHNPKYGRQFRVEQYEKNLPSDSAAILKYLSSRTIRGVGPKKAQKIVELFGTETFDVIENHAAWLTQIPGISAKAAGEISQEFKKQAGVRNAMLFFRDYFGAALTVRIYHAWGTGAVEKAKANPYALCDEIEGIGFEKADAMGAKLGIQADDPKRIESGILHILSYNATQNGHTCLPGPMLVKASAELLGVNENAVLPAVDELMKTRKIRRVRITREKGSENYYYDRYYYECERTVCESLVKLNRECIRIDSRDAALFIEREERRSEMTYAQLQREAIAASLENGVAVLTGGPGTGKTTVVRALLHIFKSMDLRVALCAPTGRAAKRLSEATSDEAGTVHRLLEMSYGEGKKSEFLRNEKNRLEEDVVIVDESSMLDLPLTAALLRAIKPGARLILIGDSDQLPSVGPGNVLHDIIACGRFATIRLTQIFRQAENSLIVTNAHAINHGEMPELRCTDGDFFFLPRQSDREIADTVAELCRTRLPRAYGPSVVGGIQVVSPTRRGEAGSENLNRVLQSVLNPPASRKREHKFRDRVLREGDRVMQIRNNYDLSWERGEEKGCGVFNGDIGVIEEISPADHAISVAFDDRHAVYDFTESEELDQAYAVTVHKSQGSEYPVVIMALGSAAPMLLTRNLFYTAVTRAQRMVILVGRADVIETMVKNNRQSLRYTGLAARLALKEEEA